MAETERASDESFGEEEREEEKKKSKKQRYRKDKPWDTPDIDHWKIEPVTADNPLPAPIEESSFATLFPKYREKYIREVWPLVTRTLKGYGVACELNLLEGSMTVKTTRKMWDPYIILKARDLIKLLARSIPVQQCLKVLADDMHCDIIKIKNMVRNKERFVKRRQRLIGPNGCTLKAIELVSNCYVMVQGNTVSAMGSIKGLKAVRRIVEGCMQNVHPIYMIKTLMIRQELAKDPKLKDENWDRFLPQFKRKNVKRKKKERKEKGPYTPFPPDQLPRKIDQQLEGEDFLARSTSSAERRILPLPRKIDQQLESGEFFLKPKEKKQKDRMAKQEKSQAKKDARQLKRQEAFTAPDEQPAPELSKKKKKRKKKQQQQGEEEDDEGSSPQAKVTDAGKTDLERLKAKLLQQRDREGTGSSSSSGKDMSRYLLAPVQSEASSGDNNNQQQKQKKKKKRQREAETGQGEQDNAGDPVMKVKKKKKKKKKLLHADSTAT
eukprot:g35086.t1